MPQLSEITLAQALDLWPTPPLAGSDAREHSYVDRQHPAVSEAWNMMETASMLENLTTLTETYPDCTDIHHAQALAFEVSGKLEDAIDALGRAIALSTQYHHYIHYQGGKLRSDRADLYLDAENWPAAIEDYTQAIFLDHLHTRALYRRGWAHRQTGNMTASEKDYSTVMRITNQDTGTYPPYKSYTKNIPPYAEAFWTLSAYRAAIRLHYQPNTPPSSWTAVITAESSTPPLSLPEEMQGIDATHDAAAEALQNEDLSRAGTLLESYLSHRPDCQYGHHKRAILLQKQSKDAEALDALNLAIHFDEQHHKHYHFHASCQHINRGHLYVKTNRLDAALADYLKAGDLDTRHADAYRAVGEVELLKGNADNAIEALEKARMLREEEHREISTLLKYSRSLSDTSWRGQAAIS